MKKYLFILCALSISLTAAAQDIKIGVRTGLSYFKLQGELEANESQKFSSGFLFGITGQYNFSESFGVRAELSYIQKSSQQEYKDNFLTVIKPDISFGTSGSDRAAIFGGGIYSLKKTFNVFSIPLHVVYKPFRRFEFFGGVDIDFIAGVVGQGNQAFDNMDTDNPIFFTQTFNYNYGDDSSQQFAALAASTNLTIDYDLNGDGEIEKVILPKTIPAYYYFEFDSDKSYKAYKSFDVGLSAGLSYYINPGLYIRAIANYGLRDSSNQEFDYSLQDVNSDASFIFRDDYDRKLGGQISLGFQF